MCYYAGRLVSDEDNEGISHFIFNDNDCKFNDRNIKKECSFISNIVPFIKSEPDFHSNDATNTEYDCMSEVVPLVTFEDESNEYISKVKSERVIISEIVPVVKSELDSQLNETKKFKSNSDISRVGRKHDLSESNVKLESPFIREIVPIVKVEPDWSAHDDKFEESFDNSLETEASLQDQLTVVELAESEDERPRFQCCFCPRFFYVNKYLKSHIRMKHYKGMKKTNQCNQCFKCFSKIVDLLKHKDMHKLEKKTVSKKSTLLDVSLQCSVCKKVYKRHKAYLDHLSKHNGSSTEKK